MNSRIKCTCGWSWNKSDSSKKDMYICHECGRDNSNNMKNGGWLDKHNVAQEGETLPSVRNLINDTMNRKIQAHKGKGKETNVTQKDNVKTTKPKIGKVATAEEKEKRAIEQNKLAYEESQKEAAKDWVQNSMQKAYQHPLMSLGYFTPEGALIGAMQAGIHSGVDLSEGDYKGAAINAGLAALPFVPQIAKTAGKALGTEEGLLSNAYKVNPFAFKPQQGKIYRQVGKPGFDDALMEGKVYDKGQKQFLENNPNINYLDEYNDAVNAKGLYLKKPSSAPFFSKDELFFPIDRKATGKGFKKTANSDAEYLIEGSVPDEALLPRYMDKYLKPGEKTSTFVLRPEYNNLENFKTYKRDWLQGYKEVPKQKNGGWLDQYADGGTMQEQQENYNDYKVSAPEGMIGDGFSNVGRDYSPAWGGQFEEGGEIPMAQKGKKVKPIYVESKNDPRYRAYQDSLFVNNSVKKSNKDFLDIHNRFKNKTITPDQAMTETDDKVFNQPYFSKLLNITKNPKFQPTTGKTIVDSIGGHTKTTQLANFPKPQQQVIVKDERKPNTTTGKQVKENNNRGMVFNQTIQKKPIQTIQNNLQPIGIQNAGLNIETELPQIRQHVVQPKYYDVEDYTHGSTSYGGTQTNYITDDLSTLSQQTPNNTRKIVPHYAMGGSLPGAVGFTYARTQGSAPSNGKYAKKTKASAQDGEKLDVYDNPLLARRVDNTNIDRSYYDPRFNTMNIGTDYNTWKDEGTGEQLIGEDLKYHQDKLLAHENYHALQHLEGRDNYDIAHDTKNRQWAEMQKRPEMMSTDSVWNNFYNRSALENRQDYTDKINDIPEARLINQNLLFDKVLDRERYSNPANLEGEAKFYEDTGVGFKNGGKMQYYQNGLDWKPKSISRDGGWLDSYDEAQKGINLPSVRDIITDTTNRKIQAHKGKGKETTVTQKDNTRTVKPKEIKQVKKLSGKQQNELALKQSEEQARKDQVFESMQEVYKHPLGSPGYFTPEGAAIGALESVFKVGPDLYEGNYGSAALNALGALPAVAAFGPELRSIKTSIAPELRQGLRTAGPSFGSKVKSEIDWGKWNKEIPENPQLMKEYNAIEQTSKANNTWMKNPDGSAFQGTPEQFVQQNSENFKNAFGNSKLVNADGSPKIIYHGTRNGNLVDNEFKAPSSISSDYRITNRNTVKDHNYFASNKEEAERYASGMPRNNPYFISDPKTYDIYANIENPYLAGDLEVMSAGTIPNISNYDAATNLDLGINTKNKFAEIAIPYWNKVKSATGNNGMFDMTNPNIYKAIVPGAIGVGALQQQKDGGIIKDDRGQWNHPGEITEIGSNDITMEGVPYDVLGISDTGDTKLMKPGKNYKFKGKKVTEYPMAKNGLRQEQKGLQNLDQLTNFTNYNKPTVGGWLNKYN